MESFFQNCVSEFDLNLFEQTSPANQATSSTCFLLRKRGMARMKDRMKSISQVITKARETNAILGDVQKELQDTRKELEDTKTILFEKNEEHKVICNERNTYFNDASEYSNEIKILKQQLKLLEEKDFNTKMKDQIIEGYSVQMLSLKTEADKIEHTKKQCEKGSSLALMRANKMKDSLEKKLIKVLNDYVYPTIKKRDKWLQNLMTKYPPNKTCDNTDLPLKTDDEFFDVPMLPLISEPKEELIEKTQKSAAGIVIADCKKLNGVILDDAELPANSSKLNQNASVDFDYAGSIDTGRGSSLALSEGEKSFYSPDYYMDNSPSNAAPNLCSKCNILKMDVSTSPIPQRTSNIADITRTESSNRCSLISKRDACTSPMPSQRLDVSSNTADFLNARCVLDNSDVSTASKHKSIFDITASNKIIFTEAVDTPANWTDYEKLASYNNAGLVNLPDDTIISKSDDDDVNLAGTAISTQTDEDTESNQITVSSKELSYKESDNATLSIVELANEAMNTVTDNPGFDTITSEITISIEELPSSTTKLKGSITPNREVYNDHTNRTPSPDEDIISTISTDDYDDALTNDGCIFSTEIPTTSAKLPESLMLDTEEFDDSNSNRTDSPMEDFTTIPEDNIDYTETIGKSSKELSTTPENSCSVLPINDQIESKNTLQERECLKLNNSNIFSNDDITTDTEIQTILNKMQLRPPLLTPIPTTPPRIITQSSKLINDISTTELQNMSIAKKIDECLNLVRNNLDEVFAPLHSNLPKSIDQIIGFSNEKEILRRLLRFPIKHNDRRSSEEMAQKLSSSNATESRNISADNLNTASMWREVEIDNSVVSEPENDESEDNSDMQYMKSEVFEQVISAQNNNYKNGTCKIDHKLPEITENRKIVIISNDPVVESDFDIGTGKYTKDKRFNNNNDPSIINEHMHESISNDVVIAPGANDEGCVRDSIPCTAEINDVVNEINDCTTRRYNNIIYETEVSDDDMEVFDNSQQLTCAHNNNSERQQMCVNQSISKMKKLTKLEKLRLKMAPKGKIKYELKHTTKKPRFKPKPIIIAPKKRVTDADSAASLNDKSIYENAIKVMKNDASKTKTISKVPIIRLEDCTTKITTSPQKIVSSVESANKTTELRPPSEPMSGTKNNCVISLQFKSTNTKLPNHQESNNQHQSNEAVTDKTKFVSPKKITNSHSSIIRDEANNARHNVPQKCKRKRSSNLDHQYPDDETEMQQPKHLNIEKSESASQRRLLRSSYSSDSEPLTNKCNSEALHSSSANDHIITNESRSTKRMRTSVSDCQRPLDNSNRTYNRIKSPVANKIDVSYKSSTTANQVKDRDRRNTITSPQRILRSSSVKYVKENGLEAAPSLADNTKHVPEKFSAKIIIGQKRPLRHTFENKKIEVPMSKPVHQKDHESAVSYADLGLFSNEQTEYSQAQNTKREATEKNYKENLLCHMIQKYGVCKIKYVAPKIPDSKVNELCDKLDTSISHIIQLPQDECHNAMKDLVATIRDWDIKHFLVGLIKYLKDPQRKIEFFKKVSCPPAPPMTKVEQVLLYVIDDLQNSHNYRGIVHKLLMNIEYILFALNKTPEEMDVIETMSHFYALLCRSYQNISKLRLFIIDAMYCLQYKSIVVIKQCLEVWMFILPLGHMGLAKTPLVACLVYLLHFYKCDDRQDRIQDLRNTLRNKYNYDLADWNENKILDLFRTAITEIKDNPLEKKMLRLALLILAKRNGATWCQNHIVNNMVKPMIADKSMPEVPKRFCVSVLGPLLKPYPNNMKVHCEMTTDYLLTMLDQKHSPKMQESIVTSLICLNKNNNNRVIQFLLEWNPNPRHVSPEFVSVFKDYVRSKTVKTWKMVLSQL